MKIHKLTSLILNLTLLAVGLSACNKKEAAAANEAILKATEANLEEIVPKKIAVSPSRLVLSVGEYGRLSVNGIYPYGQSGPITKDLKWTSADTSIFEIDSTGTAIGKAEGVTQLRVEKLGTATTIDVVIKPASINQIIVFPEDPKVTLKTRLGQPVAQPFDLQPYGLMTNGELVKLNPADVTWESSNDSALIWSETEGAVALRPGRWTMTARYGILEKVKDIDVAQAPVAVDRLEAIESPILMRFGVTKTISVRAYMNDESTSTVMTGATATPSDATQLEVISGLQVKATGSGKSSVKVSLGGKSVDIPVYIEEATVTSITLEPATLSLHLGETKPFVATAHFSDGSTANITSAMVATSSDTSVMSVIGSTVKGTAIGSSNLRVAYKGAAAQIFINVDASALVKLEIQPATFTLIAGHSENFTVWGVKSDGTKYDLSANTDVTKAIAISSYAEVLSGNVLRTKAKGNTSLTASYIDPGTGTNVSGTATITVTDPVLVAITFDPPTASIPSGRFQDYRINGLYSDNNQVDITSTAKISVDTFTSPYSYAAVVSRSGSGLIRVRGRQIGSMKVIATLGGMSGSTVYNSTAKIIESVSIDRTDTSNPKDDRIDKGVTATFVATATYSDGTTDNITHGAGPNRTVTWYDPDNATVASLVNEGDHKRFNALYQGSTDFNFVLVDNDPLVLTKSGSFSMGVYVPCSGGGIRHQFFCLFLGDDGASCATTCDNARRPDNAHRIYDPATSDWYGSGAGGNNYNCEVVVNNHFKNFFDPQSYFSPQGSSADPIGCSVLVQQNVNIGIRATDSATTDVGAAQYFRRICACE